MGAPFKMCGLPMLTTRRQSNAIFERQFASGTTIERPVSATGAPTQQRMDWREQHSEYAEMRHHDDRKHA